MVVFKLIAFDLLVVRHCLVNCSDPDKIGPLLFDPDQNKIIFSSVNAY